MPDANPSRAEEGAGREHDEGTEWFWRIVDADGLGDVPSDEIAALRLLCRRAAKAQAAEARAASAEAEVARLRDELARVNNEFGSMTPDWPEAWARVAELKQLAGNRWQEIQRLTAAVEAAERERDAAIKVQEMCAMSGGFHARHAENTAKRAEAAEARVAVLEAALKPFANCVFNDNGDVTITETHLKGAHWIAADRAIRAARTALGAHHAED